jgi:AbrB family looped-hinge helix DNA binding protein
MHTSTISTRGQTTIPIDIQRLLNVKSGDKIQYFLEADGRVTILPKTLSIKHLKGILPKTGKSVSIEDMDEAIIEEAVSRVSK